jgi:hypothetical protein
MVIYISGPVTGIPNLNKKAFCAAYREIARLKVRPRLRDMKIINPLHIGARLRSYFNLHFAHPPQWSDYMRACVKKLMDADCVYFLSGWAESEGASVERYIAKRLGIPAADSMEKLKDIVEAIYAD